MSKSKYSGATSASGKRIMSKAQGERSSSRYFKAAGVAADVGAGAAFLTGAAPIGVGLLASGATSKVVSKQAADRAENLRLKSRAVDSLVNKAKTGNTFGIQQSGFATANAAYHSHTGQPGADGGTGNHAHGTQNQSNLKSIIANKQARALTKDE